MIKGRRCAGFEFMLFLLATPLLAESLHGIKPGDYLREDYISAIVKTRSPREADKMAGERSDKPVQMPVQITAEIKNHELGMVLVYNFHEGIPFREGVDLHDPPKLWIYILKLLGVPFRESVDLHAGTHKIAFHPNGTATDVDSKEGDPYSGLLFSAAKDGSLLLTFGKRSPARYAYVGDSHRFVARQVLAGTYVDVTGKRYSFSEQGTASFGTGTFPYTVGLDYVGVCHGDYFFNRETYENFKFGIENGVLSVYRTLGEDSSNGCEMVEMTPFIKARKKREALR